MATSKTKQLAALDQQIAGYQQQIAATADPDNPLLNNAPAVAISFFNQRIAELEAQKAALHGQAASEVAQNQPSALRDFLSRAPTEQADAPPSRFV